MEQSMNKQSGASKSRLRKAGWLVGFLILGYILGWGLRPAPGTDAGEQYAGKVEAGAEKTIWTCSMHPQIRLDKPGLCPICNMKLIPVKVDGASQAGSQRTIAVSDAAKALMDIETSPVARMQVSVEVRMVGKVDYDERRVAHITAWAGGRIDRMFVDFTGQEVKKGDAMVMLYSPAILSAQEELLQAARSLSTMNANPAGMAAQVAKASVDASREKLRLMGLTAEQVARLEEKGVAEDDVTIYSPVSGTVVQKYGLEGTYLATGERIYTVADLSRVWVKMDAYESDLMWLKEGQTVEFTTVSLPGESFAGRIAFIDPVVDEMTRTVKVRVEAENPGQRLKPGIFVKAVAMAELGTVSQDKAEVKWTCPMHPRIIRDKAVACPICNMNLVQTTIGPRDGLPLVIPATAPLFTGKRAMVYVQAPDSERPTFVGREVTLGPRAGDYYVVADGLSEGEMVVTRGSFKLDSELQIQGKASMMNPEGGQTATGHEHGAPGMGEMKHD
jgi:Cu(I)/Ag(I) efflux system membrane fusion protein